MDDEWNKDKISKEALLQQISKREEEKRLNVQALMNEERDRQRAHQ